MYLAKGIGSDETQDWLNRITWEVDNVGFLLKGGKEFRAAADLLFPRGPSVNDKTTQRQQESLEMESHRRQS